MDLAAGGAIDGELILDYLRSLDSSHSAKTHLERLATALLPSLVVGDGVDLYGRLRTATWSFTPRIDSQVAAIEGALARWAEESDDLERLRALAEPLLMVFAETVPQPIGAWSRLVADPLVSPELREGFLANLRLNSRDAETPRGAFIRSIDWSAILLADDPLADLLVVSPVFENDLHPHHLAARASPRIVVQRWAWERAPLPATSEELQQLIASEDAKLREIGYKKVLLADDTRWLPLLHRAVREAPTSLREKAIDRLAFFADESSLPVLTALLDDPVFAVRAKALEALETIESVLEKQEKWRERFGEKKGKKESR
jgi:hypothetical protein